MSIWEGNKWKTVFQTKYNTFKYHVILFGLFNAFASFQDYINKIFAEKLNIFIIIYLDNILIYIKDIDQPHIVAI